MKFETKMKLLLAHASFWTLVLISWIIAKFMGWINTPLWLEMLPYSSAAFTVLTFIFSAGIVFHKIINNGRGIDILTKEIREFREEVRGEFRSHEKRITRLEAKVSTS